MQPKLKQPIMLGLCSVILLVLFQYYARFLVYGAYSFPTGDDLGFTNTVREIGIWRNVVTEYFSIIGRYSTVFMISFVMHFEDIVQAIRIYNVSIYTLLLLSCVALSHALFKPLPDYRLIFSPLVALIFLCLFLGFIAYPWEVYFWTSGTAQYQPGFVCLLLLLVLITKHRLLATPLYIAIASLLVIFTAGTVEVVAMLLPAMLVYLGLFEWYRTKAIRRDLAWLLAVALIGMSIVALAPGNDVRYSPENVNDTTPLLGHMVSAAIHMGQVILKLTPIFGAALLALSPLFLAAANHYRPESYLTWPRFLLLLAGGMLAFYLTFLTALVVGGHKIPHRGIFPILFFVWLYVLFAGYLATALLRSYLKVRPAMIWLVGVFGISVSIIGIGNFSYIRYMTYNFAELEAFDQTHQTRLRIMAEARANGEKTAVLPPLAARPAHLLYWDIGDEDKFGYREQYAHVFGLESVSVKEGLFPGFERHDAGAATKSEQ